MTDPYTPTREMAQSAAQKANKAEALVSHIREHVGSVEARVAALEAENADLAGRLERLERLTATAPAEVTPIRIKRKAA